MRTEEEAKTRKLSRPFCGVFPKGSLRPIYGHTGPLPLPLSSSPFLTHSLPPSSLSFPLFCNIPSLNVQPVCPGRLSEYATSRLDTLHGWRDQNGPRRDLSTKTNRHAKRCVPKSGRKAANMDEAISQFRGVSKDGVLAAKMERGQGRAQTTEPQASGMAENTTQGLALNSGSVHPVFRLPVHCHNGVQ